MSLQVRLADLAGRVAREFNEFRDLAGHNRRLAPFHMALANQDVAPCVVQVIGDSVSEGAATNDPVSGRWVKVMERSLRDLPGGSGFLPAWFLSPFVPQVATYSHAPVQFGAAGSPPVMYDDRAAAFGFATRTLALQKLGWVEWTFFGDRARIWYAKTDFFGREGTVTIDGVVYNDVVGSNSATNESPLYWDTPPLTRGEHTIRVAERQNIDGILWVDGLQVFDGDYGKGVHVYETTRSGASAQFLNSANTMWQNSLTKTNPSLVIVFLGFNDTAVRTPAQFNTDMRQLVSTISGKLVSGKYTLAFVLPWASKPEPSGGGWAAYWQTIETIAGEHPNGVVVRINDRWPLMTQGVANLGMFATDTVHPNESGQRMLGSYIASALDLPNKAERNDLVPQKQATWTFFGPGPNWFSTQGWWDIPPGCNSIDIEIQAPGHGGGSGRRGATGSVRCGGGGGASGAHSRVTVAVADLPPGTKRLYYSVPSPGAGGAAVTADNTNGNAGQSVTAQSYVSLSNTNPTTPANLVALADNQSTTGGGRGGTASSGAGGVASLGTWSGLGGAAASATGAAGGAGSSAVLGYSPGAGGAGGGLTSGNAASNGGAGGYSVTLYPTTAGGAAGVSTGTKNGGDATVAGPHPTPNGGGGGGASHASAAAGNGGKGGNYGGGGGGGGASVNGQPSGAGGDGGSGYIRFTARF